MPVSKNRKQHKEKAKARAKKMLEQKSMMKEKFLKWAKKKEDELSQSEHTAVQV
jgi:hypothetical protein